MKIVSFTMVNNESEIIESFIRYNYNFIDEMVIIDNGCTDHTIKIIENLVNEGYNIKIFDESLEAYDQFRLDNKYLTKIIDELKPDLIIPLDADEFLASDENPRIILETLNLDRIYYVTWRWYVLTNQDDKKEAFIPNRLQYCLTKSAWNYSDKKPVTKAIIPANYYRELGLKLSMGHHTVFGNDKVKITHLDNLQFAHYRAIGEQQLVYKTCCYTMRDIATMENNFETAQRTNQMSSIEQGQDLWETVVESSYGGYPHNIEKKPLNLDFCQKDKLEMKYTALSNESIENRILYTGREMAIRAYNSERLKKEKPFLKPIILWLDGIKGEECIFPNPSNELTMLTEMFNVRGLITLENRIKFLKANYRIIVMPDFVKFLPHEFIVIPNENYETIKENLINAGLYREKIISLREYKKELGIFKLIYCWILFIPSMIKRINQYFQRNGLKNTLTKIKLRMER
ncbi:glycosyltransferase family 2 protein [Dubosiella newyorkensis]|uniref:glycosyltransferase family 2 protein n=1 Tax=Dubosiella newyorkensis TaxID=1862672 RepID=UPI0032B18084